MDSNRLKNKSDPCVELNILYSQWWQVVVSSQKWLLSLTAVQAQEVSVSFLWWHLNIHRLIYTSASASQSYRALQVACKSLQTLIKWLHNKAIAVLDLMVTMRLVVMEVHRYSCLRAWKHDKHQVPNDDITIPLK